MMSFPLPHVSRVILVFKSHLDLGFTDFASRVARKYFTEYIPRVIDTTDELATDRTKGRLVWTTGSWLIYEALRSKDPESVARLRQAILDGHIRWHALPFTLHSELAGRSLFEFGLTLSKYLDRRFGTTTLASKMTDVPGHTREIIAPMAEAGIRFLHIGVNPSCSAPEVPDLFRWRNAKGQELMVAYAKGDYGQITVHPDLNVALAFCHAGDNILPPTASEVKMEFEKWSKRFPKAEIVGGSLEDFVPHLESVRDTLPVVESEIGDTWIHGVGTDPQKVRAFQLLNRFRETKLKEKPALSRSESFRTFSRHLLCTVEHTWGLDTKLWPRPNAKQCSQLGHYERSLFERERRSGLFLEWETSWQEQRNYVNSAVEALEKTDLADEARALLKADLKSKQVPIGKSKQLKAWSLDWQGTHLHLDQKTGGLMFDDTARAAEFCGDWEKIGVFTYQVFDYEDYQHYFSDYNVRHDKVGFWARPDFTKLGLEKVKGLKAKRWHGQVRQVSWLPKRRGGKLLLLLELPKEAWTTFGAPQFVQISWKFATDGKSIATTLSWKDKPACRLPEAAWFSHHAQPGKLAGSRLVKLGGTVDPADVVVGGARHLHAADSVVTRTQTLSALGAPLVSLEDPTLLVFPRKKSPTLGGVHFNLVNNVWGTNFPMWNEGAAKFDFIMHSTSSL